MVLRPDLAVTRSWRAFQLSPDVPSDGIPGERYLSAKFGGCGSNARIYANVCAAGRGEGIDFAFERIRRTPNTMRAHRLIHLAAAEGDADRIVEALFQAYFLKGLDIGNVEVLAEIAALAGFDPTDARTHLASEAGAEEVRTEARQARRLGIRAVPCFVLDSSYVISGAQEPEIFLPLFDIAAGAGKPDAALC
jgi:predicted DsbA family dithiol-disulfide isomerase